MILNELDLKVKHLSEQYMNLPSAPEPDDILYWCKSNKKKIFNTHDLIKVFGIEKLEQIDKTLEYLDFNNYVKILEKEQWIDPKSFHWFFHSGSDDYMRVSWSEFSNDKSAYPQELIHLGLAKSEDETEAEELHKVLQEYGAETGEITIIKYELLKNG